MIDTGKLALINQMDWVLSRCGRKQPPVGSVVYLYRGFLIQAVLPASNTSSSSTQQFYKTITGDTTWCWRSISIALSATPPAIMAQITTPDGKVIYNGILDLTAVAGYGSNRFVLTNEIECPPGSKIQLGLDDNYLLAAAVQPVAILLGGAYAYYLQDGIRSEDHEALASELPRVFGTRNQNIMAPCWMMGFGPATPEGYEDLPYIYGNGSSNIASVTLGSNLSTKCVIPIAASEDFHVRRFLFDITQDDTVTAGTFLMRIRAGSGYVFTDDYVDASKYLGSTFILKAWELKKADSIIFEITLVDGAGTGTITVQCFADGVKRRKQVAA
jgi:hypothetical protein